MHDKNDTVHDLVLSKGGTEEEWERIKRPIGLKFGAKTPAELAIAIVAELVDERYKQNYSEACHARKHDSNLSKRAFRLRRMTRRSDACLFRPLALMSRRMGDSADKVNKSQRKENGG